MGINKPFFKLKKKQEEVRPEEKVLSEDIPFYVHEAYKTLRTNLAFSMPNKEHRVVMVTSAYVSEGKSTSCLNTAITFAETGAKVCVVDCDLRKPNVARLCQKKGSPGLSNVLAKFNRLEEVVHKNVYPNLDFLFSGDIPPNPAELLESEEMDKIVKKLSEIYDYVFIDTPPVNVVTDAVLLASRVDGVLMVINQQSTVKSEVGKAVAQLEFVEAKILGVLLNNVKTDNRRRKGKRGHHYGGYYATYGYGARTGVKKDD